MISTKTSSQPEESFSNLKSNFRLPRYLADKIYSSDLQYAHVCTYRPRLSHFHHLYCYLFVEFDKFWLSEKPANVMEFNRIRDLFENNVRATLADPEACLRINVEVDIV